MPQPQMRCPLIAVREQYSDNDDDGFVGWAPEQCGEPVRLVWTGTVELSTAGRQHHHDDQVWRVECDAGHVLALPDTEDRPCPFLLGHLAHLIAGHLPPSVTP